MRPSIHLYICHPPSPSSSEVISRSSLMQTFFSLALSFFFYFNLSLFLVFSFLPLPLSLSRSLFPSLLSSPSHPTRLGSAAALGAQGLWLGQKRTGCKTETNSELGHHCFCVRGPLCRWKAARQEAQTTLDAAPGGALDISGSIENARAREESKRQRGIYVIRAE